MVVAIIRLLSQIFAHAERVRSNVGEMRSEERLHRIAPRVVQWQLAMASTRKHTGTKIITLKCDAASDFELVWGEEIGAGGEKLRDDCHMVIPTRN